MWTDTPPSLTSDDERCIVNRNVLTPVAPLVRSGRDLCAALRANISAYDAADVAAAEILGSSLSRPFRAGAGRPVPRERYGAVTMTSDDRGSVGTALPPIRGWAGLTCGPRISSVDP